MVLFCILVTAITLGWRSSSLASAYCGASHTVAPRILWRLAYCGTSHIVEPRILWSLAYCGASHIVEPRILWRLAYCGASHIVAPRILWRLAYHANYPKSQCSFLILRLYTSLIFFKVLRKLMRHLHFYYIYLCNF